MFFNHHSSMGFGLFGIVFILIFIIVIVLTAHNLLIMFSPRHRAKWIGKQVDTMKILVEDKMDDIKETEKIIAEAQTDLASEIVNEKEEELRNISSKLSDITSPGIEKTVRAFKDGLSDNSERPFKYCKHCGVKIDEDSHFCKHCGKEQ